MEKLKAGHRNIKNMKGRFVERLCFFEKKSRYDLWVFLVLSLLLPAILPCYAQSDVLVANSTASEILPEVKQQITNLCSSNPNKRVVAASTLGKMGKKAVPAIPFLIKVLEDQRKVKFGRGAGKILLAKEAERTLVKIGRPAIDALVIALKNSDVYVRSKAVDTLGK
ncbi:MAG: HEAT repeat domain-containing protein [Candidatus Theseobacter exili]|nr:HEAT repeat domain-containing protein [Candidatus Theseobacter exili]